MLVLLNIIENYQLNINNILNYEKIKLTNAMKGTLLLVLSQIEDYKIDLLKSRDIKVIYHTLSEKFVKIYKIN